MKSLKIITFISVLLMTASLSGCGKDKPVKVQPITADMINEYTMPEEELLQDDDVQNNDNQDADYADELNIPDIIIEPVEEYTGKLIEFEEPYEAEYSFVQNDLDENVHYGSVQGLDDSEIQKKINDKLKNLETDRYDQMVGQYSSDMLLLYSDSNILSVLHKTITGEGSSSTYYNFNMHSGEILNIYEVADLDQTALRIFENDRVEFTEPADYDVSSFISGNNIVSSEDIIRYIQKASFWFDDDGNLMISVFGNNGKSVLRIEK